VTSAPRIRQDSAAGSCRLPCASRQSACRARRPTVGARLPRRRPSRRLPSDARKWREAGPIRCANGPGQSPTCIRVQPRPPNTATPSGSDTLRPNAGGQSVSPSPQQRTRTETRRSRSHLVPARRPSNLHTPAESLVAPPSEVGSTSLARQLSDHRPGIVGLELRLVQHGETPDIPNDLIFFVGATRDATKICANSMIIVGEQRAPYLFARIHTILSSAAFDQHIAASIVGGRTDGLSGEQSCAPFFGSGPSHALEA
jgi:hypothetical protein